MTGRRIITGALLVGVVTGALLLTEPGLSEDVPQRIVLAVLGAALLVLARLRPVATPAVALWAGLCLGSTLGSDLPRVVRGDFSAWSHYHYLVAAEYFPELGYTGLYDQTLAADPTIDVSMARDLATYAWVPVGQLPRQRAEAWTDERWDAFGADLAWYRPRLDWRQVVMDRGYNAPPTGQAIYRQLARLPTTTPALTAVGLIDPLLLALTFGAVAWAFGPVRALAAAAWLALYQGNEHRIVGQPLLYDYLVALLWMACAWRRGWHATAGGLLAYATMVRVFPGLLVAGLVAWSAGRWWASGRLDPRVIRFGAAFALGCLLLAGGGSLSARGPGAWLGWGENIALHSDTHRTGERRVGLQHVFTWQAPARGDWPTLPERERAWAARRTRWAAAAALLLLLWGAGAVRAGARDRDPLDELISALWVVFVGVVLSRYYGSAACLLFLVSDLWGAGLLALVALHYAFAQSEGDRFAQFWFSNVAMGVVGFGWLLTRLASPRHPQDQVQAEQQQQDGALGA